MSVSSQRAAEPEVGSPVRERSAAGLVLLGAGLLALALNLRIGVVSVPPELNAIEASLRISPSIAGLLTTIPVVAYGVFAFCTPRLTRAIGLHRLLGVAVLLIAAGIALRLQPSLVGLFAGTLIVGAAIAIGNVLMPAAIKQDFSNRVGLMMGLYTTTMSLGAALAAGLTVPLQTITGGGWRLPLALWAIPAVLAFVIWVPQMLRSPGRTAPGDAADAPSEAGEPSFRALLTDRVALAVTAAMGIQGMSYYAILTWVPSLLRDHGASAHQAGWLLAFSNFPSILASLVTPALARRCRPTWIPIAVVVVLCGLGFLALAVAPIALAYPAMVVLGLGQGAGLTLALCTIVWRSPDARHTAHVSTMAQGFGYLFGGLGPLAFGLLHAISGGWNVPLLRTRIAAGRAVVRRCRRQPRTLRARGVGVAFGSPSAGIKSVQYVPLSDGSHDRRMAVRSGRGAGAGGTADRQACRSRGVLCAGSRAAGALPVREPRRVRRGDARPARRRLPPGVHHARRRKPLPRTDGRQPVGAVLPRRCRDVRNPRAPRRCRARTR